MEILLYEPAYERIRDRLQAFDGLRPVIMREDGTLHADGMELAHADARPEIGWADTDLLSDEQAPTREFMVTLLKSDRLRWVQTGAAGLDHPVWRRLAEKGIRLTRSDATAVAIAEYVLAAVLEAYHPGRRRLEAQARRAWERLPFREIRDSHWVVVGLGPVGIETAARARAFGARVTGIRRRPDGSEPVDDTVPPGELTRVLPDADVVVLAVPETPHTRRLIDAERLAAMQPGSILINISRGTVLDEAALLEALDRGAPSYAVLDVFETEPLPDESPFWSHPRVRVTAHCAAATEGTRHRGEALFLDNLQRYLANQPLRLPADPDEQGG